MLWQRLKLSLQTEMKMQRILQKRRRQDRVRQFWIISFLRGQQSKRVRIPEIKAVEKSRLWDMSLE